MNIISPGKENQTGFQINKNNREKKIAVGAIGRSPLFSKSLAILPAAERLVGLSTWCQVFIPSH